jgi:RNA polymerase sigma factor (TIGR02999 family)
MESASPDNAPIPLTVLVNAAAGGDPRAAKELLPLVYDELRRLAASRMARERSGQTLQPTALVHEAYLRLIGGGSSVEWNSRRHFFAAAAIAMRRIMVERARRVAGPKRGGGAARVPLSDDAAAVEVNLIDWLSLDEALTALERHDRRLHELVMLRFVAGMSMRDVAAAMSLSLRTVERDWEYARAWLYRAMTGEVVAERRERDAA